MIDELEEYEETGMGPDVVAVVVVSDRGPVGGERVVVPIADADDGVDDGIDTNEPSPGREAA